MSRDKKPEHLGFELSEGEGFNRDRVSVFFAFESRGAVLRRASDCRVRRKI